MKNNSIQTLSTFHLPKETANYFKKYALSNWSLEIYSKRNIDNVVVVPALMEAENVKKLLASLSKNDRTYFDTTAIIFVVNNIALAAEEVKQDNQKTLDVLKNIVNNIKLDEFSTKIISSGLRVGFVDASSSGNELPEKDGGVGLARKIGMDLALTIFNYNSEKKKLIICLDADCIVEQNYLTEIIRNFYERNFSAAVVKFIHQTDEAIQDAITCYEIFLHYYVLGLKYAGSNYAFHTVGSTIACTDKAYIKSEGMNKRKAAEDFYFVEKLAKNYTIDSVSSTTVFPSPRKSWRVPFGTGQRVGRFLSGTHNEYLLYNPESFVILKKWLDIFNSQVVLDTELLLENANNIHNGLYNFLIEQNFKRDWERIFRDSKTNTQISKQKHFWFDGFRTMKLIHYLRDRYYPAINMFDAVDELLILLSCSKPGREDTIPPMDVQKEYVNTLRNLTFK